MTLQAVRLLLVHLPLVSAIVLPVAIPKNLLDYYLTTYVVDESNWRGQLAATRWTAYLFDPVATAALIYALNDLYHQRPVRYIAAMIGGLRCWLRLFITQLIAYVLIALGLLALLVPGIFLMVRWSLLDCAVVLEDHVAGEARRRSAQLTSGFRWKIFSAGMLVYAGLLAVAMSLSVVTEVLSTLTDGENGSALLDMLMVLMSDCLIDILLSVVTILLFLFYQAALKHELRTLAMAK